MRWIIQKTGRHGSGFQSYNFPFQSACPDFFFQNYFSRFFCNWIGRGKSSNKKMNVQGISWEVNKVIWLCWGYRFWFLLIFWEICVHEIEPFMLSLSVFIQLTFFSICGPICKHLLLLSEFCKFCILWAISSNKK